MEQVDLERIARLALKDLGVAPDKLNIAPLQNRPGQWRIDIQGNRPARLTIKCGQGSTPQWVRAQILEQYLGQS